MLINSLYLQEGQALWDNLHKGVISGSLALSTIALAVLGGGYYGGIVVSAMTYNHHRRNGMGKESIDLRKSMIVGGITGAVMSGYVATALSVHALALI